MRRLGRSTFEAGKKLLKSIAHKSPETAEKLKQLEPGDVVLEAEIVAEVRRIADAEPTVKAGVESVATAAILEGNNAFPSLTKLAETINGANFGSGPQINNFNV